MIIGFSKFVLPQYAQKSAKKFQSARNYNSVTASTTLNEQGNDALSIFKQNPNSFAASSLINTYKKRGKPDMAMEVYNTLIARSITPDVYVFSALILLLQRSNHSLQALEIINDMIKRNVKPDGFCTKLMVITYADTGNVREVKELMNGMTKGSITLNNMDCSQLAQALSRGCKVSGAIEILELMDQQKVQPDRTTFGSWKTNTSTYSTQRIRGFPCCWID